MNTATFLFLLAAFSTITGLVALIVGGCGCVIYYQLNGIPFTANNIIYAVLMGFASALSSTLGYDKVKQSILQIKGGKTNE